MGNKNNHNPNNISRNNKPKAIAKTSTPSPSPSPQEQVSPTTTTSARLIEQQLPTAMGCLYMGGPANNSSSTPRNGQPSNARRMVQRKPHAEPINVETTFSRRRGATADLTVTSSGVWFNHVKVTRLTFEDGTTHDNVEYPFDREDDDFVQNFTKEMSEEEHISFLERSWVEIIIDVATNHDNSEALFAQLDRLGPDFTKNLQRLDIRVHIPDISLIRNKSLDFLSSSDAGQYLQKVVSKIREYEAIRQMNVVLAMPHDSPDGLHDIQLGFILPFFLLRFTRWHFTYQFAGLSFPKPVPESDLHRLVELNEVALRALRDAENKTGKKSDKKVDKKVGKTEEKKFMKQK